MEIIIKAWDELTGLITDESPSLVRESGFCVKALAFSGQLPGPTIRRALLIISRLPRRIYADHKWLRSVRDAVDHFSREDYSVVTSSSGIWWEYTAWYAARRSIPLIMALSPDRIDSLSDRIVDLAVRLALDPQRTFFVMPITDKTLSKEEKLHLRDCLAFDIADYRFPVVVRPKGFWEKTLSCVPYSGDRYRVSFPKSQPPEWRRIMDKRLSASNTGSFDDMMVHWTRGTYGPWIGEVEADYFEALTVAKLGNPRDGLATLKHIAAEGILRGSGKLIKGGVPVISFMPLDINSIGQQSRFRTALGNWTFEPYGIALPRTVLEQIGARPVIYGSQESYTVLPDEERPYFQYHGSRDSDTDWEREREWRITGDVDISSFKDQVLLITPMESEAEQLRGTMPYRVVSVESSYGELAE